jgi:WD40 repeat protein
MAPREIVAATVSKTSRLIVLGDEFGGLHACDLAVSTFPHCRKIKALDPHDGPVNCVAILANDGDSLCVSAGANDGTIAVSDESRQVGFRKADAKTGQCRRSVFRPAPVETQRPQACRRGRRACATSRSSVRSLACQDTRGLARALRPRLGATCAAQVRTRRISTTCRRARVRRPWRPWRGPRSWRRRALRRAAGFRELGR